MSSFKIELKGLEQVKKEIRDIPKNSVTQIKNELKAFGMETVTTAKQLAPTDEGHLKSSISYKLDGTTVEIIVATDYAAYVEFGTRKHAARYLATLPSDWQAFAKEFKGGGGSGSLEEMLLRIMAWVRRKGISGTYSVKTKKRTKASGKGQDFEDAEVAYAIALKILREGVQAHPFLYPAVMKNKPLLIDRLNALFK